MNIKSVLMAAIAAVVFAGTAPAAETVWAPPAEIASKVPKVEVAPAAAPEPAATPSKGAVTAQVSCDSQADAKKLRGKKRKQFLAECSH
jgi:psiF repeat